jgi:hypothetical protein
LLVEEGAVLNGSVGMNEEPASRLLDAARSETNDQGAMVKGA